MSILRVGCYERVSSDDQKRFGFSIETQIENLEEYCRKNNMKIVDHYTDEGVSGAKVIRKRPALARLLEDVKAGKIDIILFTRLDRYFRNVQEYFKCQEILDKHNVHWKAIHEEYDTTTPNGRFAITIFLAIAQNERDKGSVRVSDVLQGKLKKREVSFGGKNPWGYKKERDENGILRLVKDPETQEACQAFWDLMLQYENMEKAGTYVNNTYGVNRSRRVWYQTIRNDFYSGVHKGVEDYCEPYISREDWLRIVNNRPIKATQQNRVYLFVGLIRCPKCGRILGATHSFKKNKAGEKVEYNYYRCREKANNVCSWRYNVSENKIERYLLENVKREMQNAIEQVEQERAKPKPKPKVNVQALKEKMRRLNVTYMAGNKTDDEYIKESNELKALIAKAEEEQPQEAPRNLDLLKNFLQTDFQELYPQLDRENKRAFWRGFIKKILVEGNDVVGVKFF